VLGSRIWMPLFPGVWIEFDIISCTSTVFQINLSQQLAFRTPLMHLDWLCLKPRFDGNSDGIFLFRQVPQPQTSSLLAFSSLQAFLHSRPSPSKFGGTGGFCLVGDTQ